MSAHRDRADDLLICNQKVTGSIPVCGTKFFKGLAAEPR